MKRKKNYLFKLLFILGVIFIASPNSFPQQFKLTNINSTEYSIDKIAQQIYFKDFFSDTVRMVDLKTLSINKTGRLVLLPFFANKHHFMLYGNNDSFGDSNKNNIYLYNLDNHSYFLISDSYRFPSFAEYYFSFSPNDSNFIFIDNNYLSMNDTSLKPLNIKVNIDYNTNDAWSQWSSDSSIVFMSHDTVMVEYFLSSQRIDTLTITKNFISRFAYNIDYNILAYSVMRNDSLSRLYFHYKNSEKDSLIFSPERDDPTNIYSCWGLGDREITSLSWSPDNKKLAFFTFQFIDISSAGIYIFSIDSNRTYKATGCDDWGRKYHLKWANNDTLIYVNETDKYIYGMDVSSVITSINHEIDSEYIQDLNVSIYPNPFNNNTKIKIVLPTNTIADFTIYDITGKIIKKYELNRKEKNIYEIIWDGKNNNNQAIASGVYLGILKSENLKTENTKTIKIIYLK